MQMVSSLKRWASLVKLSFFFSFFIGFCNLLISLGCVFVCLLLLHLCTSVTERVLVS